MISSVINPGPPVEIYKQAPSGTLVQNQDSKNAIWIGDSNVSPGLGTRLGALGSLTLQSISDLFACVDTGVNTPVIVTVGNDVSAVSNPVDIATATALELSTQGVPNVLLMSTIISQSLISAVSGNLYDCSKYANIQVQLSPPLGNSVTCQLQFLDSNNFICGEYTLVTPDDANNEPLIFSLPNLGIKLKIIGGLNSATGYVYIVGSNRSISTAKMLSAVNTPVQLKYSGNITSGNNYQLIPNTGYTPAYSYFNGRITGWLSVTGNTLPDGNLMISWLDKLGNTFTSLVTGVHTIQALNSGLYYNINFDFQHPLTPLAWLWVADNDVVNFSANLWLNGG